uniref:EAL domain-containing protein n=1 Tax=Albidovulum sp. TaxID=1872424 RepID=UPI0039B85064
MRDGGKFRRGASDPGQDSPLSAAVGLRDRDTLAMVARAVQRREVFLAFQPVVQAARQDRPAFYEGLIRLVDETGRIIPAREFIATIETTELGRAVDCLSLDLGFRALKEDPGLRLA